MIRAQAACIALTRRVASMKDPLAKAHPGYKTRHNRPHHARQEGDSKLSNLWHAVFLRQIQTLHDNERNSSRLHLVAYRSLHRREDEQGYCGPLASRTPRPPFATFTTVADSIKTNHRGKSSPRSQTLRAGCRHSRAAEAGRALVPHASGWFELRVRQGRVIVIYLWRAFVHAMNCANTLVKPTPGSTRSR